MNTENTTPTTTCTECGTSTLDRLTEVLDKLGIEYTLHQIAPPPTPQALAA